MYSLGINHPYPFYQIGQSGKEKKQNEWRIKTMKYKHITTSMRMREFGTNDHKVWRYFAVTYEKGNPAKIVFQSGINSTRDDAAHEVMQFLRTHPEYINEWVN